MKKKSVFLTLFTLLVASTTLGTYFGLTKPKNMHANAAQINREFLVGSWSSYYDYGIKSFEAQTAYLNSLGLNFTIFPHNAFATGNVSLNTTLAQWQEIDRVYKNNNMYYLLDDSSLQNYPAMEKIDRIKTWSNNVDNAIGYFVKDEPDYTWFDSLANYGKSIVDHEKGRYPFVNFYPSIVGSSILGGTYDQHVRSYIDKIGAENIEYLSFDRYPFTSKTIWGQPDGSEDQLYADAEVIRKAAFENGKLKTHAFTQTSGWGSKGSMPTIDQIRWNMNLYLAYGYKALSHFLLVFPEANNSENFKASIIGSDGNLKVTTSFANSFAQINNQTRVLGQKLMNLDTVHAYHTKSPSGGGVEMLPSNFLVVPDSFSDDFMVSYMVAKDGGSPYIMLFNKSYTSTRTNKKFKVATNSGITDLQRVNSTTGAFENISLSSNAFTDTFAPGEAKLYRLNGGVNYTEPVNAEDIKLSFVSDSGNISIGAKGGLQSYTYEYWVRTKVVTDGTAASTSQKDNYVWQKITASSSWVYKFSSSYNEVTIPFSQNYLGSNGEIQFFVRVYNNGTLLSEIYNSYISDSVLPTIYSIDVNKKTVDGNGIVLDKNSNANITVRSNTAYGTVKLKIGDTVLTTAYDNFNIDLSTYKSGSLKISAIIGDDLATQKDFIIYLYTPYDAASSVVINSLTGTSDSSGATTFKMNVSFASNVVAITQADLDAYKFTLLSEGQPLTYNTAQTVFNNDGSADLAFVVNYVSKGIYYLSGEVSSLDNSVSLDKSFVFYKGFNAASSVVATSSLGDGPIVNTTKNTSITLSAKSAAISGVASNNLEYAYYRQDASGWTMVRDYNASSNATVNFTRDGTYLYQLRVKDKTSQVFAAFSNITVQVGTPGLNDTLSLQITDLITGENVSNAYLLAGRPYELKAIYAGSATNLLYKFQVATQSLGNIDLSSYSPKSTLIYTPNKTQQYTFIAMAIKESSYGYQDVMQSVNIYSGLSDKEYAFEGFEAPGQAAPLSEYYPTVNTASYSIVNGFGFASQSSLQIHNLPWSAYTINQVKADVIKQLAEGDYLSYKLYVLRGGTGSVTKFNLRHYILNYEVHIPGASSQINIDNVPVGQWFEVLITNPATIAQIAQDDGFGFKLEILDSNGSCDYVAYLDDIKVIKNPPLAQETFESKTTVDSSEFSNLAGVGTATHSISKTIGYRSNSSLKIENNIWSLYTVNNISPQIFASLSQGQNISFMLNITKGDVAPNAKFNLRFFELGTEIYLGSGVNVENVAHSGWVEVKISSPQAIAKIMQSGGFSFRVEVVDGGPYNNYTLHIDDIKINNEITVNIVNREQTTLTSALSSIYQGSKINAYKITNSDGQVCALTNDKFTQPGKYSVDVQVYAQGFAPYYSTVTVNVEIATYGIIEDFSQNSLTNISTNGEMSLAISNFNSQSALKMSITGGYPSITFSKDMFTRHFDLYDDVVFSFYSQGAANHPMYMPIGGDFVRATMLANGVTQFVVNATLLKNQLNAAGFVSITIINDSGNNHEQFTCYLTGIKAYVNSSSVTGDVNVAEEFASLLAKPGVSLAGFKVYLNDTEITQGINGNIFSAGISGVYKIRAYFAKSTYITGYVDKMVDITTAGQYGMIEDFSNGWQQALISASNGDLSLSQSTYNGANALKLQLTGGYPGVTLSSAMFAPHYDLYENVVINLYSSGASNHTMYFSLNGVYTYQILAAGGLTQWVISAAELKTQLQANGSIKITIINDADNNHEQFSVYLTQISAYLAPVSSAAKSVDVTNLYAQVLNKSGVELVDYSVYLNGQQVTQGINGNTFTPSVDGTYVIRANFAKVGFTNGYIDLMFTKLPTPQALTGDDFESGVVPSWFVHKGAPYVLQHKVLGDGDGTLELFTPADTGANAFTILNSALNDLKHFDFIELSILSTHQYDMWTISPLGAPPNYIQYFRVYPGENTIRIPKALVEWVPAQPTLDGLYFRINGDANAAAMYFRSIKGVFDTKTANTNQTVSVQEILPIESLNVTNLTVKKGEDTVYSSNNNFSYTFATYGTYTLVITSDSAQPVTVSYVVQEVIEDFSNGLNANITVIEGQFTTMSLSASHGYSTKFAVGINGGYPGFNASNALYGNINEYDEITYTFYSNGYNNHPIIITAGNGTVMNFTLLAGGYTQVTLKGTDMFALKASWGFNALIKNTASSGNEEFSFYIVSITGTKYDESAKIMLEDFESGVINSSQISYHVDVHSAQTALNLQNRLYGNYSLYAGNTGNWAGVKFMLPGLSQLEMGDYLVFDFISSSGGYHLRIVDAGWSALLAKYSSIQAATKIRVVITDQVAIAKIIADQGFIISLIHPEEKLESPASRSFSVDNIAIIKN